jgi:DNA-directed RNA polymerase I subunit RPA2
MMHELVLGGHLYLQLLKEKLETWLLTLRAAIVKKAKLSGGKFDLTPQVVFVKVFNSVVLDDPRNKLSIF